MDKTLYTSCMVDEKGELQLSPADKLNLASRWAGKKVELRLKTFTKKRSLAANNYYWGYLVTPLADYCGYPKDEMHVILKCLYAYEIKYVLNKDTGEMIETKTPLESSTLSRPEFTEFVNRVEQLMTDLRLTLYPFEGDKYEFVEHD